MLELLWKAIWLSFFVLPIHLNTALDDYAAAVAFACTVGVVEIVSFTVALYL